MHFRGFYVRHCFTWVLLSCLGALGSPADKLADGPAANSILVRAPVTGAGFVESRSPNSPTNSVVSAAGLTMDALDDKQKLGVGDTVVFRVLEDQEDPRLITVSDAGQLLIPELGLVEACGKTCKALAAELKVKLESTTYYHATVIIGIQSLNRTLSGRRVYVAGEVNRPGPQEIPAGETWTVGKAIMRAGGFTQYGAKNKVRVVRAAPQGGTSETYIVNIAEVWEKGRTDLDMSVEPEDLIYVPIRGLVIK